MNYFLEFFLLLLIIYVHVLRRCNFICKRKKMVLINKIDSSEFSNN